MSRANSLNEVPITATTDTQNISKQNWLSLTVGRACKVNSNDLFGSRKDFRDTTQAA